jgi:DNA (cytosine-5)-methyltransferase 1
VRLADGSLRRLTLRECAALQGFPPAWRFVGPSASRFRQAGNAVPSVFGRVLGAAMTAVLQGVPRPKPASAPLPADFLEAIDYTKKEQRRNGVSRWEVRRQVQSGGTDLKAVKGLGSAECTADG